MLSPSGFGNSCWEFFLPGIPESRVGCFRVPRIEHIVCLRKGREHVHALLFLRGIPALENARRQLLRELSYSPVVRHLTSLNCR